MAEIDCIRAVGLLQEGESIRQLRENGIKVYSQHQRNMDEECRHVSLRLWDVLERVGVSERMRQLHRDTSIHDEILQTITNTMVGRNITLYRFGSSSEGTTTPGMDSDEDLVYCIETCPVIDNIQQAPRGARCFLMIADNLIRPGYVKLQVVINGIPLTINNCDIPDYSHFMYDCAGRVCEKHFTALEQVRGVNERNGPAYTSSDTPGYVPTDSVIAYRSRTFPHAAKESLRDCIKSKWLTRDDVEKMIHFGCLFVGVGHPSSEEKDIEWRVSFSLQEKYIMFSLNATQHKCYVLLKIIKNILTCKPDVGKSITSYHCKTCMLSVIIKSSSDQWIPINLIECTLMCLTELRQCLKDSNLPNFFIRTNNMFEQRVHGQVRERLIYYLNEILNEGFRVFYTIQSDYIGDALSGHLGRYSDIRWNLGKQMLHLYNGVSMIMLYNQKTIYRFLHTLSNNDATLYLSQQLYYLASVITNTEHTYEETKEAIKYLEPVLHKLYAQHLASLAFSTEVYMSRQDLLQASAHHLRQGMSWDLMSGRLVYASILYRQGNMEMCCDLLERIEHNLTEEVESKCGCHQFQQYINEYLISHILRGNTNTRSIMESYMATCTIFLPCHSAIIPAALQYELYRSAGTPLGSWDTFNDVWYSWSAVDSKVYLYFLQYLVFSNQNKHRAKQLATENLWRVLQADLNIGHRETGYNLLGWIYSNEGRIQVAACCFLQSWILRPHHNAAKWHMLNLIYQQFAARQ